MSRPMRSWSASSASSTVARTGRPRSATTRAIRRRTDEPFVRGKCVAGGSSAAVRDQRPPTSLHSSAAQCQRRPSAAAERAALPLLLLSRITWRSPIE